MLKVQLSVHCNHNQVPQISNLNHMAKTNLQTINHHAINRAERVGVVFITRQEKNMHSVSSQQSQVQVAGYTIVKYLHLSQDLG